MRRTGKRVTSNLSAGIRPFCNTIRVRSSTVPRRLQQHQVHQVLLQPKMPKMPNTKHIRNKSKNTCMSTSRSTSKQRYQRTKTVSLRARLAWRMALPAMKRPPAMEKLQLTQTNHPPPPGQNRFLTMQRLHRLSFPRASRQQELRQMQLARRTKRRSTRRRRSSSSNRRKMRVLSSSDMTTMLMMTRHTRLRSCVIKKRPSRSSSRIQLRLIQAQAWKRW
mmetsp:Transcript_32610/g.69937  ORF Transcript_32610/g.69937 Transcript_32610/m.69937 type:complete len:220 (+) Transcript_32610:122-781(+)